MDMFELQSCSCTSALTGRQIPGNWLHTVTSFHEFTHVPKSSMFLRSERERESVDRRKPRKARNLTHNQGFTAPLAEANEVSGRRLADQAKSKKRHTQDSEELLDLDTGCVLTQVQ